MPEPIRVFIGCSPDGLDAESAAVCEYSLRKRASLPVDITWMIASRDPASFWSGWDMSRWATPFSGFRWGLPVYCGFEGRAIYMDTDTVVLADIAELWNTEIKSGKVVVARSESKFCVSLWDCAAAKPHMLSLGELRRHDGHRRMLAYFASHPNLVQPFAGMWNYLDIGEMAPLRDAKILHYTDLSTQPHLRYAIPRLAVTGRQHWYDGPRRGHPRQDVVQRFEWEFAHAREAGYAVDRYIPGEVFGALSKRSMRNYRATK